MRTAVYQALVNRQPGIQERYHRAHDGEKGVRKMISWIYLLWLNFCYYVFFCRFLGKSRQTELYEEKRIPTDRSESESFCLKNNTGTTGYAGLLAEYDVISFDIFDTLIFRPFSEPADLFFLLGEKLNFLDFKRVRMEAEAKARREKYERDGSYEATLADIWHVLERETGLDAGTGMCLEQELELELCYANPCMFEVYRELKKSHKIIVAISDMYLPEEFLTRLLDRNGYGDLARVFVSNTLGKSKWNGQLFAEAGNVLRQKYGKNIKLAHIGDNFHSDVKMAPAGGFTPFHYPNADAEGAGYRVRDMSALVGGAYRGIVNHHLYAGYDVYSREYEYGYVYGGLFVVGYCAFIHEYVKKNQIDRLLFLSRDGDILKQVYDLLYPCEQTKYVYWSRAAALKLTADENRYDFFRRFLYHKMNRNKKIAQILREMELEELTDKFDIESSEVLTSQNVERVKECLLANWDQVLTIYRPQKEAAEKYCTWTLAGARRAAAVDIGWAGSGAIALRTLAEQVWKLPCEVIGIIAGTNSIHNVEPDAAVALLKSGKLVSYLFSQEYNRDLFKKHNPAKDDNVYWELLLASPTRQFLGFYPLAETAGRENEEGEELRDIPNMSDRLGIALRFGETEHNLHGCQEIQKGILDFAEEYRKHFAAYPYMFSVSGRDAYAPMLAVIGYRRRYLNAIAARFDMDISVTCGGDTVCRNI